MEKGSVHVPGFKKKLHQKLGELGKKISDLPPLMGPTTSPQTIYTIQKREMTTIATLRLVCKALGVEPSYFTGTAANYTVSEPQAKYESLSDITDCRRQLQASHEKINFLNELLKQKTELINSKDEIIRMLRVRQS